MVHALELVWQMLDPGGVMVDIHPNGKPSPIEVHIGIREFPLGLVQETDDFIEYLQAEEALQESIQAGLFSRAKQGSFECVIKASKWEELLDYLRDNWSDAVLSQEIQTNAKRLLESSGPMALSKVEEKSIQIRETITIARFNKMTS
jgi:hypothetical protein